MISKNVFLIEDDEDDQLFFTDALKVIGNEISCTIANNGKDGLDVLKKADQLPDIIFLDLNMPFMNGYECLRNLKNELKLNNIPVVIFTTSNDPRDAQITHQLGADVFLSKPNDFEELCSKLKRILDLDFTMNLPHIVQYSI